VVLPREEGSVRRLGITVTRKVAGAVGRNRVKRVLREVFRRNRDLFPDACDVVIIGKSGSPELGYAAVQTELTRVRGPMASAARRAKEVAQ
jgi:ribonuclease P protein component